MRMRTELHFFTGNTRSLDQRTNHLLITEHLNHEFQSPLSNSMKPEVTVHMQWNFITGEGPSNYETWGFYGLLTHLFIFPFQQGERPLFQNVNKSSLERRGKGLYLFFTILECKKTGVSGAKSIISPEPYTVCNFQSMFAFQTLNAMIFPDFLRVIIHY